MASNFATLWPTDSKFLALKNLNPLKTVLKFQEASSVLKMGFALSKWPHLHRAYLVTVREYLSQSVTFDPNLFSPYVLTSENAYKLPTNTGMISTPSPNLEGQCPLISENVPLSYTGWSNIKW